ncbi:amidase [Chryseolinea lacunae]|uniref:Amidase n=1 Tax=Chryseolinea lacunae TaxID=2801331 RepID=A0ABS1L278_9BACT|nr:amidase [Chryseolinea lacunae]MBL0745617.1 amidase [Chryseolinea lacunae]
MTSPLHYTSIGDLSAQIRDQKISPVDVVKHCLARIREHKKLNAFITVTEEQALTQAKLAEAEIKVGAWRGPLHGIPVGIKDFYDTAGIRTTAAFNYFQQRIPKNDADGVAKLKAAGAIIIGKTNMHQLGMGTTGLESFFGAAHNPWNAAYIPGGSSSGSAVAVASGLCYATFDTDAIGSCRLPAACCGVVGFKGTYNRTSVKGILEGEQPPDEMILWLSHAGITTRNVSETALLLDVLAANDHPKPKRFATLVASPQTFRIGIGNNFIAEPDVATAFENAVATLRSLGHTLQHIAVPFGDLQQGIRNIEADRATIDSTLFSDIDILVLPTTPTPTLTVADASENSQALSPENTAFANYYGIPAISIPGGFDTNGLPLGLQMVSRHWNELVVLQLAHQFQNATAFGEKHPVA